MKNIRMVLIVLLSLFTYSIFAFDAGKMSTGNSHSCVIDDEGVKCWKNSESGQTDVPSLKNPKIVSAGGNHICAIDDDGVKCWGNNEFGQTNVPQLESPKLVAAGRNFTCVLEYYGVRCWGDNHYGQTSVPKLKNPTFVSVGSFHACALDEDGVKCWGASEFGQTKVPQLKNPKQVSVGFLHTCAIDDDGVKCWGYDKDGQIDIPQLKNPKLITAGGLHSCAIDEDGIKCWGDNESGQTRVPKMKNPEMVTASFVHTCALDDNKVKCWGLNKSIQENVPNIKLGPNLGDPHFKSNQIAEYLETLTLGSTPVRTALFKRLSVFASDNLAENLIFSPINQQILSFSRTLFLNLIAPVILSGDSPYYIEKVIPAFKKNSAKMHDLVGITNISEIPAESKLVRKTALIIIQATLQSANDFFTVEERTQLQEINRLLGQAVADSSKLNILNALAAIETRKSLLHKLENSPKTSFLLTTLLTATEWLSSKI